MPYGQKGLPPVSEARGGSRPVVYDVTRLVTRGLNAAPNGIDRVDFALARHFLAKGADALVCTAIGPRLAETSKAFATVEAIESYWREDADAGSDPVYDALVAALKGQGGAPGESRIAHGSPLERIARNWRALRDWAPHVGRPATEAPRGAVYFSATQFLLDRSWYVRWLETRADVKLVSFVHDLLPLDAPEYFWPAEAVAHPRRNRNICRIAAGVVAGAENVARRYRLFAAQEGRPDLPVHVSRLPVARIFATPMEPPAELAGVDYFLVCGTIEPRKNHMLLLNVWRELARDGSAPKLVVVGKRGWLNAAVTDMMSRSPALRTHVIEAGGLSTPGLRRLMAGARALLAPSFAEGFGLPVAEALAAGVPVIAADIEAFRDAGGAAPEYLHPLDGPGWREAVRDFAARDSTRRRAALERLREAPAANTAAGFVAKIETFFEQL